MRKLEREKLLLSLLFTFSREEKKEEMMVKVIVGISSFVESPTIQLTSHAPRFQHASSSSSPNRKQNSELKDFQRRAEQR